MVLIYLCNIQLLSKCFNFFNQSKLQTPNSIELKMVPSKPFNISLLLPNIYYIFSHDTTAVICKMIVISLKRSWGILFQTFWIILKYVKYRNSRNSRNWSELLNWVNSSSRNSIIKPSIGICTTVVILTAVIMNHLVYNYVFYKSICLWNIHGYFFLLLFSITVLIFQSKNAYELC